MKLPGEVKVGGITVYVKLVPSDCLGDNGGHPTFADYDPYKNLIRIDENLERDQQWATLLHEILHCINIKLPEETVEFLAQAWWQVMHDNRWLK